MKKSFFTLILFISSVILNAQQNELMFHSLGSQHGLTYSAVRDIVQDSKGYIWIATLKGLNRYDGYNIKQYYKSDDGLSSNCIEKLLLLGKDTLLMGTNEGMCLYDMMKEKFTTIVPQTKTPLYVLDMVYDGRSVFIASDSGLYAYNKVEQSMALLYKGLIIKVTLDINGNVWAVGPNTIYCFRPNGQMTRKITAAEVSSDYPVEFTSIYKDSQGTLWLGTTENGLYRYNKNYNQFVSVEFSSQDRKDMRYIRCIQEDMRGNLWIGTENGLFIYDYTDNSYVQYRQHAKDVQSGLNDNAIYTIYKSRGDIMWIGTFFGGINYTSLTENNFHYLIADNGKQYLKGKAISNIIKDKKGALWFASEDHGISILYPDGHIRYLNKSTHPSLNGDNVHALAEDYSGNIWIGNFVDGLQKVDLERGYIRSYKNMAGGDTGLSNNSIYKLYVHNPDTMFIGTSQGVNIYHFQTDSFTPFLPNVFRLIRIDDIIRDKKDNIWFSAHFNGIFRYHIPTHSIHRYQKGATGCKTMTSDNIYCSFIDSKGDVWFGTSNGGLMKYDANADSIQVFGKKNELRQRDIYSIQEDSFGYLWMSTDNGIFSFNPESQSFAHYKVSDNLISNQFNTCPGYKDPNGTLYFGSINGVCFFRPEGLNHNNPTNDIHLTFSDFKVFNKHVQPSPDGILQSNIDSTSLIRLPHGMNTLTFDFLVINYNENCQSQLSCEYYLEGMETEWNTTQQIPQSVTYTNLDPGTYKFHVRVIGKNGVVFDRREITVNILPHFLLSGFMITIYSLIGLLIGFIIVRFYRIRMRDKMDIRIERMEKNNLRELNKHKLNFFTYITHEFKTPLSILMAVFEDISISRNNTITGEEMKIINRNIQRLQFLINQLLEFRSVETDHARIEYVKGDIMTYGRSIFELFIPVFRQKQVVFQYTTSTDSYYTVFDRDKIEKIISNLLSNAFKHSDPQSEINFRIDVDKNAGQLILSCHNSSSYIHPEQREAVMQPFHKTDSSDQKYSNTGIGLALVNGLVQLLSGTVEIESHQNSGTTFKVRLPLVEDSKDMIVPDETLDIVNSPDVVADTVYLLNNSGLKEDMNAANTEKKMTVLLVEDNPDINNILKSKLLRLYKVKTAYNGQEAVELLKTHIIDIIISDIMMPYMDGYELSRYIKTSREYSHIPVILITSQPSKENELQGLSAGADAYIEKPFTFDELNLRITNLLKAKSNIREHYHDMKIFELNEELNNKDEEFIKSLTQFVIEHIEEPELSVDQLTAHMNISRTQLYNKLKKLLNLSATEFINKIKIDVAKVKIIKTNLTIAEISWQLGFNNPSYFSKTFKRFCGVTPNEFKNGKGQ